MHSKIANSEYNRRRLHMHSKIANSEYKYLLFPPRFVTRSPLHGSLAALVCRSGGNLKHLEFLAVAVIETSL